MIKFVGTGRLNSIVDQRVDQRVDQKVDQKATIHAPALRQKRLDQKGPFGDSRVFFGDLFGDLFGALMRLAPALKRALCRAPNEQTLSAEEFGTK